MRLRNFLSSGSFKPQHFFSQTCRQLIGKGTAQELLARAGIPLAATYLTPADRTRLTEAIGTMQREIQDGSGASRRAAGQDAA